MQPNYSALKPSVFILNCCILGKNEVEFWNSIFARYRQNYRFHFFTTTLHDELDADEIIHVAYGAKAIEQVPSDCPEDLRQLIDEVANKDLIWETYEKNRSQTAAYSWLVFWTFAIRLFAPTKVIIWNGHHVPEKALAEVCRLEGVEVLFAERGPLAGTFSFDRKGVNCLSSFFTEYDHLPPLTSEPDLDNFIDSYFSTGVSNWGQPARQSSEEFRSAAGIPEGKTVLFFPGQVDQDTNSKLFSPHFTGTLDALASLIEWCNRHSDAVFLIVKKHPMQDFDQSLGDLTLKSGVFLDEAHIFDCIQYSDGVVSINSSSAIEAALMGKPVLLLGNSLLNHWEYVYRLQERENLHSVLDDFLQGVRSKSNFGSGEFFSKLIFGYLYSAKPEYVASGMRLPELDFTPSRGCPPASERVLRQEVLSMTKLAPTITSRLIESSKLRAMPEAVNKEASATRTSLLATALRKLRLMRSMSQ